MAREYDGSTEFGRIGSAVVSAYPFTLACWFRADLATNNNVLMGVFESSSDNNRFYIEANGSLAGDPVRAVAKTTTTVASASGSGYSTGTWHHACGVYTSATNRLVYLDGVAGTAATFNMTPSGMDRTSVGVLDSTTQLAFHNGAGCEYGWWNVALTADEVRALARTASPMRIRPGSLVRYDPFWGKTEFDLMGGTAFTLTGTTAYQHPPIRRIRPRMPRIAVAASGCARRLAGPRFSLAGTGGLAA